MNTNHKYRKILDDAAHDLAHLGKLLDEGRIRDDHGLAASLSIFEMAKLNMLEEAVRVNTQAVLFPN